MHLFSYFIAYCTPHEEKPRTFANSPFLSYIRSINIDHMKLGIFCDIHEDVVNLRKAVRAFEKQQCGELACLGDIVGFSVPFYAYQHSRNANECISIIRKNCKYAVAGNHDMFATGRIPAFPAGIDYPTNYYHMDYHQKKKALGDNVWYYEENTLDPLLSGENMEYLRSLNEFEIIHTPDMKIMISHSTFPNLSGSRREHYQPAEHPEKHIQFMQEHQCKLSICGHVHVEGALIYNHVTRKFFPFGKTVSGHKMDLIIAPGIANGFLSNGFMIFDTGNHQLQIIPLKSKRHKAPGFIQKDNIFLY